MDSLFDNGPKQLILTKIQKLTPETQGLWGKMDVAQMLAHCSAAMEVAIGDAKLPRSFMGMIVGQMAKPRLYDDAPFGRSLPTLNEFRMVDKKEFETEQERLISLINRFQQFGEPGLPQHRHPFLVK
jgi:hypothetical protein